MDDAERERATQMHDHLAATAELPVERTASRWLGEAEAVAADAASEGASETVVRKRASQVVDLLSHVEETGHEEADEHVEAARELAVALAAENDVEDDAGR